MSPRVVSNAPRPSRSKDVRTASYVSTCNICLLGIYTDQLREWSRRPMGLVHTDCLVGAS